MSKKRSKTPTSTYRVQLNSEFTFQDAAEIATYLAELGVSHLYASPYLQAAPGSKHGYDVVDHRQLNHELGGSEGHGRLCRTLRDNGLGQVLDIVPNHMAIAGKVSTMWWDVLENGQASRYAPFFDVDWACSEVDPQGGKVLLPILGDHYGRILEAGQIQIVREGANLYAKYYENLLPLDPNSTASILSAAASKSESRLLGFVADGLSDLVQETTRRDRDKGILLDVLNRLFADEPQIATAVDEAISEVNADCERLDALLRLQHYRLAYWRTSATMLNYRRFFNIDTLIGLNMEREEVFDETHRLIRDLIADGTLDGLRVDHPDGLRDPQEYLTRLRGIAPEQWIVVEKILEPGERLPDNWTVAGTTGYDFLNRVAGLFVDPAGERPLTEFYREFTGREADSREVVREKKHLAMWVYFGGDVNRLTSLLVRIAERHRCYRDYSRPELEQAIRELVACFPVYRTYVRADQGKITDTDRRCTSEAIAEAKEHRPDLDPRLFDFLRMILTLEVRGDLEHEFVMRFQQFTGPATAKGVEDTAFYCYNRLMSLNEVGGDPGVFGITPAQFHEECLYAMEHWPERMNTTSTHDTKRSEDVRVRISLLSEIPDRWIAAVRRWSAMNEKYRRNDWPDRNLEYLLYQTLVGAWPLPVDRALAYTQKAAREAKEYTTWTEVNAEYEEAVKGFIESMLGDEAFTRDLAEFVQPLLYPGYVNSLAQTLIKMTAPGVPDTYQGTELWDLSLVDPDNRRPVDYLLRRRLLGELKGLSPEQIVRRMDEGLPKLYAIHQMLYLRRDHPEWFGPDAAYRPVSAKADRAKHVVAFARGDRVVTIVPRWTIRLGDDWADTRVDVPQGAWRSVLSHGEVKGGSFDLAELLRRFPVVCLIRE